MNLSDNKFGLKINIPKAEEINIGLKKLQNYLRKK